MPKEHTIVMKLLYYDDVTPMDYEPPFFRGCTEEVHNPWTKNPLKMETGDVNNKHFVLALKVKSVLDPCEDKNEDIQNDDVSLGANSVERDEDTESDNEISEDNQYIVASIASKESYAQVMENGRANGNGNNYDEFGADNCSRSSTQNKCSRKTSTVKEQIVDSNPMLRNGETEDWIGTFEGNIGAVWSCYLDTNALRVAYGLTDFTAKIWNALIGDALHSFEHKYIVRAYAFSKDTQFLFTEGVEKILRIYDLKRPDASPRELDKFPGFVRTVAWFHNDQTILSSCTDKGGDRLWDIRTGKIVYTLGTKSPVTGAEVSQDGRYIATTDGCSIKGKKQPYYRVLPHLKLELFSLGMCKNNDAGWLKTVDQDYVGANNFTRGACVQNVLDSVISALLDDKNRKFIYVKMALFQRRWRQQSSALQKKVMEFVKSGQLEFIKGGMCMHEEATSHYIDQTTLGHLFYQI